MHGASWKFPDLLHNKALDIILSFFSALVARDPVSLSDLARKTDFTATLFRVLTAVEPEKDVLTFLSAGASDAALKEVGVLRTEKSLVRFCKL